MNRTDNVFLLTLIDFLLQIIFFGIFVYAVDVASSPNSAASESAIKRLLAHFGISDLVTLTDRLTRLVPAEAITNTRLFKTPGEAKKLADLEYFEGMHGNLSEVPAKLEKLRKFEDGIGKPPCIYSVGPDGKRIPRSIATLVGTETTIAFRATTDELNDVLQLLGVPFPEVRSLSLRQFRETFAPLRQMKPDCRYFVTFIEATRYVEPRDAVNSAFGFSAINKERSPNN